MGQESRKKDETKKGTYEREYLVSFPSLRPKKRGKRASQEKRAR